MDRRQAFGALGAVSLGGLLAACGNDGAGGSASVTTAGGDTSTVKAKTATSKVSAELFDESAACELAPELTEGPYYFDVDSIRSDITEDRKGTRLRLALRVRDAESCKPIENAIVDVWHCDAVGTYSGFEAASQGAGGGGPGGSGPSDEKTYLRGAQATNGEGIVQFTTIYPGWYRGRTVHIHCKVHLDKNAPDHAAVHKPLVRREGVRRQAVLGGQRPRRVQRRRRHLRQVARAHADGRPRWRARGHDLRRSRELARDVATHELKERP